jgi:hypothetical protein
MSDIEDADTNENVKVKPKSVYNSEYCRARYRLNKYKIRTKYFERKQKLLEDKANAFREKLRQQELMGKLY